jgi:multicomponent Na+:H+ antiporter subunit F
MKSTEFLNNAALIAMLIMTLSLVFPFYRMLKGPGLPNRVVAFDQVALIIVSIILTDAIYSKNQYLIDVVLIVSFILVLGSMMIARYLFKRRAEND